MEVSVAIFLIGYSFLSTIALCLLANFALQQEKKIKERAKNWCYNFAPRYISNENGYYKFSTNFLEDFDKIFE